MLVVSFVGIIEVSLGVLAGYVAARIIVLHSVPMVTGWLLGFVFRCSH